VTPALPALLPALVLAASAIPETPAMTDTPHALSLDVETREGMLEVRLVGHSPQAQEVRYTLEVIGQSTSRHKGATKLAAGQRAVLSTMRTAAGDDWCVKLEAQDADGAPYSVTRGACAAT
jgi:hypothetical protein